MGSLFSRRSDASPQLLPENLEEFRMLSGFQAPEIQKIYARFMDATANSGVMSRETFLSLPEFCENPLKDRLAIVFGLKDDAACVDFKHFVSILSQLSPTSPKDQKIKVGFAIYDVDGDGRVSHRDLLEILTLTVKFQGLDDKETEKALAKVVMKVMSESSSHPQKHYLSQDDFTAVLNTVEGFEQRMILRFGTH